MPARRLSIGAAALAALCLTTPAFPQATAPQNTTPETVNPSGPTTNLSDRLERSGGVIKPSTNVDPGITTPAPNPNAGTMPVIPPPGSPGGNQSVQPK